MAFVEAGGIQRTKASGGQAGYGVSTLRGGLWGEHVAGRGFVGVVQRGLRLSA